MPIPVSASRRLGGSRARSEADALETVLNKGKSDPQRTTQDGFCGRLLGDSFVPWICLGVVAVCFCSSSREFMAAISSSSGADQKRRHTNLHVTQQKPPCKFTQAIGKRAPQKLRAVLVFPSISEPLLFSLPASSMLHDVSPRGR